MCPDCGRRKMLFETERKALNFLKWNGKDINVKEGMSLRPYYCPSCCGWHISSKKFKESYKHSTERLLNAFNKATESKPIIPYSINVDQVASDMFSKMSESEKNFGKQKAKFIDGYLETMKLNKITEDKIRHQLNKRIDDWNKEQLSKVKEDAMKFVYDLPIEVLSQSKKYKTEVLSYLLDKGYPDNTPYALKFREFAKKFFCHRMYDTFHTRFGN